MIIINEFKLSDDLATMNVSVSSDFEWDYVRIYVGDNYLTNTYYDMPTPKPYPVDGNGRFLLEATVYPTQLGVTAPLTDIYIMSVKNEKNEIKESGIWSLEAPSQCVSNLVLNYPDQCLDCKGITGINIAYMNMEATVMFLASNSFEKSLETLKAIESVCPSYGDFTVPSEEACSGIGCWIIENDFIVQ